MTVVGVLGLLLLALTGSWAGRQLGQRSADSSGGRDMPGSSIGDGPAVERQRPVGAVIPDEAKRKRSMKRIREIIRTSPALDVDWEAAEELQRLLTDLPAEDVGVLYAELPKAPDGPGLVLQRLIGTAWVSKDPTTALLAIIAKGGRSDLSMPGEIFRCWAVDHPEEALGWLGRGDFPDELKKISADLWSVALARMLDQDFDLATKEIRNAPATEAGILWEDWGSAFGKDPATREKLVEAAKASGRVEDFGALSKGLLDRWSKDDDQARRAYLAQAQAYMEAQPTPKAERFKADAMLISDAVSRRDEAALDWWMAQHAEAKEMSLNLWSPIESWLREDTPQLQAWLAEQAPSPQRDALTGGISLSLMGRRDFTEAATLIETIQDPTVRQQSADKLIYVWKEKDPEGAARWQEKRAGKK